MKSVKKNIIYNTFYQVLTIIIPLITTPYVTRILGTDGVGIFSFTSSIVTYFTMMAALGTVAYGTREISRARDDIEKRSKLFWEIELLTIFTTLICIILWSVVIIINTEYKIYFMVLILNLFNVMFDISWLYAGLEEFKYTLMQNSIFKILGTLAIFTFIKNENNLILYFLIMSGSTLLGTMSMWIYLKKFIKRVEFKKLDIFRHFKETFIYFIPTIVISLYTVLDKTLIGLITHNNSENGYYEEANKIINLMKALTFTSMNTVLGSRIAYLFAQDKKDEIKKRIEKSMNFILLFGLGICFGLIMMADRFIPWYLGIEFTRSALFLKLMAPLVIIIGISNCLGSQFYTPAGLRKESTKYIIAGALTNLVLNMILIPRFWGVGAIIASLIAEILISTLYIINSRGLLTFEKIVSFSWKKLIAAILMSIVIYVLNIYVEDTLTFIIVGFVSGVLTYGITLIILKDSMLLEMLNIIIKKIKRS